MNTSLLEWPSIVLVATAGTRTLVAQNLTDSASNAVGNASESVNQTASELGNNASSALNNAGASANATMSEMGQNASNAVSSAIHSENQSATDLGKNASSTGETLLNQTVAKKIIGGAATVLGNISGEIKEGIGAK